MNQVLKSSKAKYGTVDFDAFIKYSILIYVDNCSTLFLQPKDPVTSNDDKLPHFEGKHKYFKNSFFPLTVMQWNKLDQNICNPEYLTSFKDNILKFLLLSKNSVFLCNNSNGIQLITRLRLGLSPVTPNRMYNRYENIETFCYYLRYCSFYTNAEIALLNFFSDTKNIISELSNLSGCRSSFS